MPTKLFREFPPVTTGQWEAVIRKDLKGADYARKLLWQTEEGIAVQPYYRQEALAGLEYLQTSPGQFPYTRGTNPTNDWGIREEIDKTNPTEANQLALKAIAAGAGEVAFRNPDVRSAADLKALLAGLDEIAVHLSGNAGFLKLALAAGKPVRGSLSFDPLADPDAAADFVRAARPGLKTALLDAGRFHDDGATAVQELGYLLAAGVEYLAAMTSRGITVDQAAAALAFSLAIGANYFFEIAKLRAARLLWARVVESFGGGQEAAKAAIYVRTSCWNKTIYDPYVNLLRTTTESMSAAVGGCDSFTVTPFDATYREPDEFSRHLARNTQIILKKEAWFDRAVDPAGGSWYVEALTASIAAAAWKLLQEVEAAGGFFSQNEAITGAIAKSRAAREASVALRRATILGTNQYPNRKERVLKDVRKTGGPRRAASAFEAIRLRTERSGKPPVFLLAEIGDVKMRKARSSFISNFFGCAGFEIVVRPCADAAAILAAAAETNAAAIVLCSSDEEYPALAPVLIQAQNEAKRPTPVLVAGFPKESLEQLKKDGVADFIHIRTNAVESLQIWQEKLGVKE